MTIYCLLSDGRAVSYIGMDQMIIDAMHAERGLTARTVTWAEFDAFVRAHQPVAVVTQYFTQEKTTLKDKNATTDDKLNALITILGL